VLARYALRNRGLKRLGNKINKPLRESGKREIDPKDQEMQQRYGLSA